MKKKLDSAIPRSQRAGKGWKIEDTNRQNCKNESKEQNAILTVVEVFRALWTMFEKYAVVNWNGSSFRKCSVMFCIEDR